MYVCVIGTLTLNQPGAYPHQNNQHVIHNFPSGHRHWSEFVQSIRPPVCIPFLRVMSGLFPPNYTPGRGNHFVPP